MNERTILSVATVTILAGVVLYGLRTGKTRVTRRPAVLPSTPVVVVVWLALVVVLLAAGR